MDDISEIKRLMAQAKELGMMDAYAGMHLNLGNAQLDRCPEHISGDAGRWDAIGTFRTAVELFESLGASIQKADALHNIGLALCDMQKDREKHVDQAIEAYEAANQIYVAQSRRGTSWATTQYELGYAHQEHPKGLSEFHLKQAIHHYGEALTVFTADSHPQQFSCCQQNRSLCLSRLAELP